ncbi:dfp2-like protein [Dermatophagoides farinae]|uniref:Dfp2-like protein n=1 Tax=Dermatophagoides farinae TaxID=6954 RepID=A0A9D4SJH4_DERFA|nr:dfp2-like protein [Dermatophagoides farinae]
MQWFELSSSLLIVIIIVSSCIVNVHCGGSSGGGRRNGSRRKGGGSRHNGGLRNGNGGHGSYAAASESYNNNGGGGGGGGFNNQYAGGGGDLGKFNNRYAGGGNQNGDFFDGQIRESFSGSRGGGIINAAVFSKQTFETKPVETPFEQMEPQIIEIEGGDLPIEIHFKSTSSRVKVRQDHQLSGVNMPEYDQYEEEPHRLITEVRKPIIQEVREIIAPYRKVIQEIEPVMEEIHTQQKVYKKNK